MEVNKRCKGDCSWQYASIIGCINCIDKILKDPNSLDCDSSALHRCAWFGHDKVAERLLACGANPDVLQEGTNNTPLHIACEHGHINIVTQLLVHGADPNAKNCLGDTPLMRTCRYDYEHIAILLLKFGSSPNIRNNDGKSAKDIAALHNPGGKIIKLLK